MSGIYDVTANMFGLYPNMYNNQIAMNEISGLDMYSPMGMYGSIFPMAGMGMSFPFMGGGNDYFSYYDKYQDFMVDNYTRQQERMRNANLRLNAPQEGVEKAATILREKIMQNEQQQILPALKAYYASVGNLYKGASESDIKNRAAALYAQRYNSSIIDDIRKYDNSSFTQGMLQSLTLGLANKVTGEENISAITGQPVARYERMKKVAGNAAGGAVVGVGGAIALNQLWKFKGPVAKALTRVPVLAAIGCAIAGVAAFMGFKN